MKYEIVWTDPAKKDLKNLEFIIGRRIYKKVQELADNPFRNTIKLIGEEGYRLRIGDYRVIFDILNERLVILILKVGHRSKIYDR